MYYKFHEGFFLYINKLKYQFINNQAKIIYLIIYIDNYLGIRLLVLFLVHLICVKSYFVKEDISK